MSKEVSHEDLYVTALDFLRTKGHGCTVGINDVLEHFGMSFSDGSQMLDPAGDVLKLIESLWRETQISSPFGWSMDVAWSEKGDGGQGGHRSYPDAERIPDVDAMAPTSIGAAKNPQRGRSPRLTIGCRCKVLRRPATASAPAEVNS